MLKRVKKFGNSIHKLVELVEDFFSIAAFPIGKAKQEMIGASFTGRSMDG